MCSMNLAFYKAAAEHRTTWIQAQQKTLTQHYTVSNTWHGVNMAPTHSAKPHPQVTLKKVAQFWTLDFGIFGTFGPSCTPVSLAQGAEFRVLGTLAGTL